METGLGVCFGISMKKVAVGIAVFKDKILVGKKVTKEGHFLSGCWHLPGGHVNENESEETALIREFKEETNPDIQIIEKMCSYKIKENDVVASWYLCSAKSCETTPGDDLTEVDFVEKNKVVEKCDERAVRVWPKEVLDYFHHYKVVPPNN